MARYIEYYEYKDLDKFIATGRTGKFEPDYYRMRVDRDAFNKKNLDNGSHRIWKYDTWTGRVAYERNVHKGCSRDTPVDMDEFLKIIFISNECPYSDLYIFEKEREMREAAKK